MNKPEVIVHLSLIASLAESARLKVSNKEYWEGELERDVARIQQTLEDLNRAIKKQS